MIRTGKYEFNSKEQADSKILALGSVEIEGVVTPSCKHSIVRLGELVVTPAVIDSEGVTISEAIGTGLYAVDVLWRGLESHPYGWATYSVDVSGNGKHAFMGINHQDLKI